MSIQGKKATLLPDEANGLVADSGVFLQWSAYDSENELFGSWYDDEVEEYEDFFDDWVCWDGVRFVPPSREELDTCDDDDVVGFEDYDLYDPWGDWDNPDDNFFLV